MQYFSNIEKGALLKLFNRDGYVLDFSTSEFDVFTMNSIGVALCEEYKLSKGKSLTAYVSNASEKDAAKLLIDLFDYYELNGFIDKSFEKNNYFAIFQQCKPIVERVRSMMNNVVLPVDNLKIAFSSDYISSQLDLMLKMQSENPTEAIGKAKELIESCCKTILEQKDVEIDKKWDVGNLVDATVKLLEITPNDIPETIPEAKAMKAILGNLKAIASNIATLRNTYGSGHGKSASYKGLQERHAKLAIGSSVTLVNFLWDSFERKNNMNC